MKRYDQYSKEELAVLTEEQINTLVDLEIAYAGVMPAERPTPPSYEDVKMNKSEAAYSVYGIYFKNQSDALAVSGMQVFRQDYDYAAGGYDYKYLRENTSNEVKTEFFYKKEDVKRFKDTLIQNKTLKDQYESDKKDYDKYFDSTSKIRTAVWEAYREACRFVNSVNNAKNMYDKYLQLAEGDKAIAKKFFLDAYKDNEDIVEAVFPDVVEDVAVEVEVR